MVIYAYTNCNTTKHVCLTAEAGKSASSHILERNIKEENKNSTTNESERRTNLVLVA